MNIYVYNFPPALTDKELESLFSFYGEVLSAQIEKDITTGQPKNIAYIHMPIETQAKQAITELNGLEMYGRKLIVEPEGCNPGLQNFT